MNQPTRSSTETDRPSSWRGLTRSNAHYGRPCGPDLLARTEAFLSWQDSRRDNDIYPYSRMIETVPSPYGSLRNEQGRAMEGMNFASQDYLSLSSHPQILEAAMRALRDFGPHSAGSALLAGNTPLSLDLQAAIGDLVQAESVVLFPTGWGAGFGSIVALVRPSDYIIMDNLAHACLQQGARAATENVIRHRHNDAEEVLEHLKAIRGKDTKNGILVITEGLFSMDSDSPDLRRLQRLCREYSATLLVDVAHDLGALGPGGGGQLELQRVLGDADLVMGAFSKTFASNGGFLATRSRAVQQYVRWFAGPHSFSNALSPVQIAVVLQAIRIVKSPEGSQLRTQLMSAVLGLRAQLSRAGAGCMGNPSAIVPVVVGNERVARLASRLLFDRGVFANLVEFPAVAVGDARFRLQVMAAHCSYDIEPAARTIAEVISQARSILAEGGECDER